MIEGIPGMAGRVNQVAIPSNARTPNAIYGCAVEQPCDGAGTAVNSVGNRPLIALTGATGFIGQCLLRELPKRGYRLRVLLRRPSMVPMESASAVGPELSAAQRLAQPIPIGVRPSSLALYLD